jgi:hypothetical protein
MDFANKVLIFVGGTSGSVHAQTLNDNPGRTPMPGNNSGRRQPGNSAVPSTVGRPGVDGFWVRD